VAACVAAVTVAATPAEAQIVGDNFGVFREFRDDDVTSGAPLPDLSAR
jgi:hypothetical protein